MNTKLIYAAKRSSYLSATENNTRVKYYMRPYGNPVQYSNNSRYKNVKTLEDEETGKVFHQIIPQPFVEETSDDQYYTVTLETENRLDLIAQTYYNNAKYWWVIGYANYLIDPFDVPVGTTLRIPAFVNLYKTGGVLSG